MIKKFRIWLMGVWRWYRHRSLFVILDPSDNSVTLSRGLFDLMDIMNQEEAKVFVFKCYNVCLTEKSYAFTLNPKFDKPTTLCDIQYNSKYHTVGFETLCPSVNRIFYDYKLPLKKTKLSVEPIRVPDIETSGTVFEILRPHAKPVK